MRETILVVDDEEIILNLVRIVLDGAGYNILGAGSGREAIALCQTHTGPVHLALLDVMMPGMTDPELRERLRDQLPSVRVLFMSGFSYDQVAKQGIQADTDNFLAKPFTIIALLRSVKEALEKTQYLRGSA